MRARALQDRSAFDNAGNCDGCRGARLGDVENIYGQTPWTRDGMVRTYVVTMAPEVAGRIVELPVIDNQFVHKGDLLLVIDPTDYKIARQARRCGRRTDAGDGAECAD